MTVLGLPGSSGGGQSVDKKSTRKRAAPRTRAKTMTKKSCRLQQKYSFAVSSDSDSDSDWIPEISPNQNCWNKKEG